MNHECLCPTITPSVQKCRPIQRLGHWALGTNKDNVGQLASTWVTYREQGCLVDNAEANMRRKEPLPDSHLDL